VRRPFGRAAPRSAAGRRGDAQQHDGVAAGQVYRSRGACYSSCATASTQTARADAPRRAQRLPAAAGLMPSSMLELPPGR